MDNKKGTDYQNQNILELGLKFLFLSGYYIVIQHVYFFFVTYHFAYVFRQQQQQKKENV